MLLFFRRRETHEDQHDVHVVPRFFDHVGIVALAFVFVGSPDSRIGRRLFIEGILWVFSFVIE